MKNAIVILVFWVVFLVVIPLQAQSDAWPRKYQGKNGQLVVYPPQVDSWKDQSVLEASLAAAVTPQGSKTATLGTFKITGHTEVDKETRQVRIQNIQLAEVNFPALDPQRVPDLTKALQSILPQNDLVISLDRILTSLHQSQALDKTVQVKDDPPPIYFSTTPALLVQIDGQPVWSPIAGTQLKYAVNTNWDLFQDAGGLLFLRNENTWLKAPQLYGPWEAAGALPADFQNLPKNDANWKDVLASLPGKALAPGQVPTVFVSPVPAEMIVTEGTPKLAPIPGTHLSYVSNTGSDLFVYAGDRNYYYAVSGRWFKSPGGPGSTWSFASNSLPADFRNIPRDSPKAEVLAIVPGTPEAEEAVIAAKIPHKATVKRDATATVEYAGDPKFEPIPGTSLQYAANTGSQVLEYKNKYYLVKDGVWFVADSATGPWTVADKIPPEIYDIPPSSPVYNVTYVKVYEADDDSVTYGYTAGYLGAFVVGTALGATLAYGTGWYYPPYVYGAWYYPRPYSYGVGAYYNPWTGSYGRYGAYYGPYGGVGYGAAYNPVTGTYVRGAAVYGPYQARGYAQAYNPWTNTYAATRQGSNAYANWGSSVVQRDDKWVQTGHYSDGGKGVAGYQTSAGNQGFVAKGDDLYAGRDGNVYRKTDDGWQKYDNGSWNNVGGNKSSQLSSTSASQRQEQLSQQAQKRSGGQAPSSLGASQRDLSNRQASQVNPDVQNRLDRDSANRDLGNRRVQDFDAYQRSGGARLSQSGFDRGGFSGGTRDFGGGGFGGGGGGGFRGGGGGGGFRGRR